MHKVKSAPQLTSLVPQPITAARRPRSENGDHHAVKGGLPLLGRRRSFAARALLPGLISPGEMLHQMETLTQSVESEVVLEAETNTVGIAAASCFAEFGLPDSYDAPELAASVNMTEDERDLAACLATPFEGDPEERSLTGIVPYLTDDEQLMMSEMEKKHLRALATHRRRKRKTDETALNWRQLAAILKPVCHYFAWSEVVKFVYKET